MKSDLCWKRSIAPVAAWVARAEAEAIAVHQRKHVGLDEKLYVYPAKLSGGQQRRVAIARAARDVARTGSSTK